MSQYWDDELYHHGTKGMKWGRRLYQNEDGTLTPLGRIRYGKEKARQLDNLAKARAAKQTKAEYEANKQKALKSGSAKDVLRYQGDLTKDELNNAVLRIGNERKLKAIADEDVKSGWAKIESLTSKANKITNAVDASTKLYNAVAKVNNAFNENKLPTIGNNDSKKNDEKKDKKS